MKAQRTSQTIESLFFKLSICAFDVSQDLQADSDKALDKSLQRQSQITQEIQSRSKHERVQYFLKLAKRFCNAYQRKKEGFVAQVKGDMETYRHFFLQDTSYPHYPLKYEYLKRLIPNSEE